MYRYRLFEVDGADRGEAYYAVLIKPGETILTGDGRKLHVRAVIPGTTRRTSGCLRWKPDSGMVRPSRIETRRTGSTFAMRSLARLARPTLVVHSSAYATHGRICLPAPQR
jgi:hypothetical protein